MAELRDAVPTDLFLPMYNDVREEVLATDVNALKERQPTDVVGVSLFMWDEMVHRGIVDEPFKIAPIINNGMIGIYEFVKHELGSDPVTEVFSVRYFNELSEGYSFVDVTLVQCFPDDIHICDVEFADLNSPVDDDVPVKGAWNYHGLHIFGDFVRRLKEVARERGVGRISLVVGAPGLPRVFEGYGFKVSETKLSKAAARSSDAGYAMVLEVD